MTIPTENSRDDYIGNGATSIYAYTYRILAEEDLLVTQRDTSNIETTLVLNTDYTVSGVGDSAGTITLAAGNLVLGYVLSIRRNRALTQETDIRNQGSFYPESHEDAFDDLTMKTLTLKTLLDMMIKVPESVTGIDLELPVPVALRILRWNSSADAIEAVDVGTFAGVTTFSGGLELTSSDLHIKDLGVAPTKLIARAISVKTADYTILSTDNRGMFTNEGAVSATILTLPSAAAGLEYTAYVQSAQLLTLKAGTGDTIRNAVDVSATAGTLASATVGCLVKVVAINTTEWIVESITGAWTIT